MNVAKRRFQLTDEQVDELRRAHTACKHEPTRARYQAVWLYGTGCPVAEIVDITGCSRTSLMEWCRSYRVDGVAGLVDKRAGGNRAKLKVRQIKELRDRLHVCTPAAVLGETTATFDGRFWTVEDLQRAVQRWYGVSYSSRTSYHRLFDVCGFSYCRQAKGYKPRAKARADESGAQCDENDERRSCRSVA